MKDSGSKPRKVRAAAAAIIVKLAGPLDRWGSIRLRLKLLLHLARGCKKLILDLRRVPWIDSDGIRTLRGLLQDHSDVSVEIAHPNKNVRKTLSLIGLDSLCQRPG